MGSRLVMTNESLGREEEEEMSTLQTQIHYMRTWSRGRPTPIFTPLLIFGPSHSSSFATLYILPYTLHTPSLGTLRPYPYFVTTESLGDGD
jgi:hypothetical protein